MITRLRVDARLFNSSAHRRPGIIGRPLVVGKRQATLAKHLADPKTRWHRLQVTGWYGRNERLVEIVFGTALWHHPGSLVPIRYVLVRDVASKRHPHRNPQDLQVVDILRWSVRRWWIGVTFAEVRCHLGAETRRQWSDPAIARTTPALLGLFSLITLRAHNLYVRGNFGASDGKLVFEASAHIQRCIGPGAPRTANASDFHTSAAASNLVKLPRTAINALIGAAYYDA